MFALAAYLPKLFWVLRVHLVIRSGVIMESLMDPLAGLIDELLQECNRFEDSVTQMFDELDQTQQACERAILGLDGRTTTPSASPDVASQLADLRRMVERQGKLICRWLDESESSEGAGKRVHAGIQ